MPPAPRERFPVVGKFNRPEAGSYSCACLKIDRTATALDVTCPLCEGQLFQHRCDTIMRAVEIKEKLPTPPYHPLAYVAEGVLLPPCRLLKCKACDVAFIDNVPQEA